MFTLLSRLSTRFPIVVVALTGALFVASAIFASGVFPTLKTDNGFTSLGTQSQAVADAVQGSFSSHSPAGVIMFTAKQVPADTAVQSAVDTPNFSSEVQRLSRAFQQNGRTLTGYYTTYENRFVSQDRTKTFALVSLPGSKDAQYQVLDDFQKSVQSSVVGVTVGGEVVAQHQASAQVETDLKTAELITLPILAILLLLIFRGVVAAALPLGLGILAIVGGIAVVRLLTTFTNIDQYALNVITVLGLGLSVDYSLLMVSRFREELSRSDDVMLAVRRTVATSGRTIFFSGLTVIASLLSLTVFPIPFLRSIGLGGTSAIVIAVFSALIVLPALLMLLGRKINAWQIIRRGQPTAPERSVWHRLGRAAIRYPVLTIAVSGGLIAALAWPLHHVSLTSDDYRTLPTGSSAKSVGQDLATRFGQESSSVSVLFQPQSAPTSSQGLAASFALTKKIAGLQGVTQVTSPTPDEPGAQLSQYQAAYSRQPLAPSLQALKDATISGGQVLLSASFNGSPTSPEAKRLVERLRALSADGKLQVGGVAAEQVDTVHVVGSRLPLALGIIAVSMFLLLGLLLRSIVIPLQAILINSLGLLASFGVLVTIFQDGHFTSSQWLSRTGGLNLTIPLLIFAIAFGLSMDYAAFIYARMREEYDAGADNAGAIVHSLERTGGIITAAAVLLFVVVAAFASSKIAFLQQVGIGLSVAVLIDAFVIRLLLVPAVMKLFGTSNWYAPSWMQRFRIRHE